MLRFVLNYLSLTGSGYISADISPLDRAFSPIENEATINVLPGTKQLGKTTSQAPLLACVLVHLFVVGERQ